MSDKEMQSPEPLTPRQEKIVEELEGLRARLEEFDHFPADKMEELLKDEATAQMFRDYERVVIKALRARLDKHPPIENLLSRWVRNAKALGQKTRLRKVRRRMEIGVKRPLKKKDAELLEAFEEILYERGKRQAPIQVSEEELSSITSLEDIIQLTNRKMVFDPEDPPQPPKDPTQLKQVHKILIGRRKIKMSRQGLLDNIKRIQGK